MLVGKCHGDELTFAERFSEKLDTDGDTVVGEAGREAKCGKTRVRTDRAGASALWVTDARGFGANRRVDDRVQIVVFHERNQLALDVRSTGKCPAAVVGIFDDTVRPAQAIGKHVVVEPTIEDLANRRI